MEHLELANKQSQTAESGKVVSSTLFSASRFAVFDYAVKLKGKQRLRCGTNTVLKIILHLNFSR